MMNNCDTMIIKSPYHEIAIYDAINAPAIAERTYDIVFLRELLKLHSGELPSSLCITELFGGMDYYSEHLALLRTPVENYTIVERNDNGRQHYHFTSECNIVSGDARNCRFPIDTNLVVVWYYSLNAIQTRKGMLAFYDNLRRNAVAMGRTLLVYCNIYPNTVYSPAVEYYEGANCTKFIDSDRIIYSKLTQICLDLGVPVTSRFIAKYDLVTKRNITNNSIGLFYKNLEFTTDDTVGDPYTLLKVEIENPILVRPWSTGELCEVAADVGMCVNHFYTDFNKPPYSGDSVHGKYAAPVKIDAIEDISEQIKLSYDGCPGETVKHPTDMIIEVQHE